MIANELLTDVVHYAVPELIRYGLPSNSSLAFLPITLIVSEMFSIFGSLTGTAYIISIIMPIISRNFAYLMPPSNEAVDNYSSKYFINQQPGFIESTFRQGLPSLFDQILDSIALSGEDCPRMMRCYAGHFYAEVNPYAAFLVNQTTGVDDNSLKSLMSEAEIIFFKSLVEPGYCSKQKYRCSIADSYKTLLNKLTERLKTLLPSESWGSMKTATTTTTPSPFVARNQRVERIVDFVVKLLDNK